MKKVFLVFILAAVILAVVFFVWQVYFTKPFSGAQPGSIIFEIKKGENFQQIGANLKKASLINSELCFDVFVLLNGQYRHLQAGTYQFMPLATMNDRVAEMVAGHTLKEYLTIIEGWTLKDIAKAMAKIGLYHEQDILAFENLEGHFFPDTYEFLWGVPAADNLKIIFENFDKKVGKPFANEIARQGRGLQEIIIMASILEKEVKTYQDKQIVAGILWKRLASNWPLQVDAAADTYRNKGLPEAPICNPGLESVKAAVYYKESEYWYYLSAKDGKTIFSKTFEEHKAAREKYLK